MIKKHRKERTAVDVLFAIIVAVFCVVLCVCFIHSNFLRLRWINLQLNKTYGISISYDDSSVDKKWTSTNNFYLHTTEGIEFLGTCNFFGKIETESYVHYYYADESVEHIRDEIGSCFDECIIINDMAFFALNTMPYDMGSIGSYDEYLKRVATTDGDSLIHIKVLIRESENIDHVVDAIRILESNNEAFVVRVLMIPDNIYDAHLERGVYFYQSRMEYTMSDLINSCGDEYVPVFRDVIVGPNDYVCGMYCKDRINVKIDGEWVEVYEYD